MINNFGNSAKSHKYYVNIKTKVLKIITVLVKMSNARLNEIIYTSGKMGTIQRKMWKIQKILDFCVHICIIVYIWMVISKIK